MSVSLAGGDDKERIRAEGRALGFDVVGFASSDPDVTDATNLRQYLAEKRHGDMEWLQTTADRRQNLTAIWPEARSAICCAVNYGPDEDPLAVLEDPDVGAISVYARGDDYHRVIKSRLKAFARWLSSAFGCEVKVFVDTAPIMEKPLAMRAGLGWIGKHTNLVSRAFGSWLFLGEILTNLVIEPDAPEVDHCGRCDACLRACPTGALDEPYRMDARRCISYLTIEHKEDIDPALARDMGNRVFGCDDCLAVCPWNKFSKEHTDPRLRARDSLKRPLLSDLQQLDETTFKELFARTSIRRTGVVRFARNTRIAINNKQKISLS